MSIHLNLLFELISILSFKKISFGFSPLATLPKTTISPNKASVFDLAFKAKLLFNFAKLAVRGIPEDYKIQLPINYIHKKGYQIPAVLDVTISFKPIVCSIKTTFFKTKNI